LPATCAPTEQSGTRVTAALYAGRPVLPLGDLARLEELSPRWREIREEQLAEWQSRPSMRDILAQAITDTVSSEVLR
jgi:hypothetical protein